MSLFIGMIIGITIGILLMISILQDETTKINKELKSKELLIKSLSKDNEKLLKENKCFSNEFEKISINVQSLKGINKELSDNIRKLLKENQTLTQMNQELLEANEELSNDIDKRKRGDYGLSDEQMSKFIEEIKKL